MGEKVIIVGVLLITLMMEAGRTSETLIHLYQTTRRKIPEYSRLHTLGRENLKSYLEYFRFFCKLELINYTLCYF